MGSVIAVDQFAPTAAALDAAGTVLAEGGVVVLPTDSVYGISALATPGNPGHLRIFDIKRRDRAQTLPWLVAERGDLTRFGMRVPSWATDLAAAFWPGALTLVVEASARVPSDYLRDDGTIALRMPASPLVCRLAATAGVPLATTSANTHGAPSPRSFSELEPVVVTEADLTLDGGTAPEGVASTIVGCVSDAPVIFREGAISRASVEEVVR